MATNEYRWLTKPCEQCLAPMTGVASRIRNQRFCSRQCLGKSQRTTADTYVCSECGAGFFRMLGGTDLRNGRKPKFCSAVCYGKSLSRDRIGVPLICRPETIAARAQKKLAKERAEAESAAAKIAKREEAANLARALRSSRPCLACRAPVGEQPFSRLCCTALCSDDLKKHGKRRGKQKRRALLKSATVESFLDVEIFRRDGWLCQLCGAPTPEGKIGTNHSRAPTIDHIVALVNGGMHSRANVQCACRICNSIKSDGPARGQIGLWHADSEVRQQRRTDSRTNAAG